MDQQQMPMVIWWLSNDNTTHAGQNASTNQAELAFWQTAWSDDRELGH